MDCLKDCNGACCKYVLMKAKLTPRQTDLWEPRIGVTVLDDVGVVVVYAPCRYFNAETGKCATYESRPIGCKQFQAGNEQCNICRRKDGY